MYESFYGLHRDPFRLRPDAGFAFRHDSYARARNQLDYALFRGEGVALVTGAPGSGKTTLVDDLLAHHTGLQVARIDGTHTNAEAFLRLVAFGLGMEPGADRAASLIAIQRCLQECARGGRRALLVVDNAQDLPTDSIGELHVLGSGDGAWELQVLLLGTESLRERVKEPQLEGLRQRIIAACELDALGEDATREYIRHRLDAAGSTGMPEISKEASALIHHYSGGNPRRINMLCARLLLKGFAEDRQLFNAVDVRRLAEQLGPDLVDSDEVAAEAAVQPVPPPAAQPAAPAFATSVRAPPPPAQRAARVPVITDVVDDVLGPGEEPRWKTPTVPLGFDLEFDAPRRSHANTARAGRASPRASRAGGRLATWLALGLVLAIAVAWFASGIGVDRGGSGWQLFQDALTDYIERILGR